MSIEVSQARDFGLGDNAASQRDQNDLLAFDSAAFHRLK